MSLMRLFMQTTYEMAANGQWSLMTEYFTLVSKIFSAKELVIIPGAPKDKEPTNG